MPFGYEDHLLEKSPLRKLEETLRNCHCDESVLREWRLATLKACKFLDVDVEPYALAISDQIWSENLHPYCKSHSKSEGRQNLDRVCKRAAEPAILFRSHPIELEWEQDLSALKSLEVNRKDHQIIGTTGPHSNEDTDYEIAFIVFGGLVKGDRGTGLLEYRRVRLDKGRVVIGSSKT